jgi:hypothetical protein
LGVKEKLADLLGDDLYRLFSSSVLVEKLQAELKHAKDMAAASLAAAQLEHAEARAADAVEIERLKALLAQAFAQEEKETSQNPRRTLLVRLGAAC